MVSKEATATEKIEVAARAGQLRRIWQGVSIIFASRIAMVGLVIVLFWVFVAIFAPFLTPYTPLHQDWKAPNQGPSVAHILGTDELGRDLWSRLIYGARIVLVIMPISENFWIPGGTAVWGVFVALLVGMTLGLLGGFYGGWIDEVIMRFVDIMYAIPMLVLSMAIVVAFGRGLDKIIWALALVQWRIYVRLIRAEILTIRERDFIQAAKAMGVSDLVIMLRHILPNAIYPVLIVASLNVGSIVITAAFMSFLGLGAPPGYADWGQMVALARNYILGTPTDPFAYWFTIFCPGIAIVLFVLAWNLIGDALRDAFDPRQRRR